MRRKLSAYSIHYCAQRTSECAGDNEQAFKHENERGRNGFYSILSRETRRRRLSGARGFPTSLMETVLCVIITWYADRAHEFRSSPCGARRKTSERAGGKGQKKRFLSVLRRRDVLDTDFHLFAALLFIYFCRRQMLDRGLGPRTTRKALRFAGDALFSGA